MKALFRVSAFVRLAFAYALGEVIEWLAVITLALVVYDETQSALATTALFLSTKLAPSILTPLLAARTDRFATPRGIGALCAVEALVFVALALATSTFSLALICALALIDGCLAGLVRTYTRAAVATTMEPLGRLREANASLNVLFGIMNVAGPAIAGAAAALLDPELTLFVAAGLLLCTALVLAPDKTKADAPESDENWRSRITAGLRHLKAQPVAARLIVVEGLVLILGSLPTPIIVVYTQESLGTGPGGYAAITGSWGLGLTVGSIIFARLRATSLRMTWIVSTALMGVGFVVIAGAPTLLIACAAAVVGGTGNGMQWVSTVTLIQERVSSEFQVRIAGVLESLITLTPAIGFALGGIIAAASSARVAFVIAGGFTLLLAAAAIPATRGRQPAPA